MLKLLRESASGDSQISPLLIPTDGNALHEPLEFQFGRLGAVQNGVRGEFALMRRPGFRKGHRNAFPSEFAQRGRMSRTTFSAGVFALLVLGLIFVLFATTMSEFSSAMELLQIIPKALTSDTLHL